MNNLTSKEKSKLFSIFENIDEDEIKNSQSKTANSDILLIDGNNTFMRAFMANPALDDNGEHIGGIDGFFKSIGYAIRMVKPTRCIVIFDGHGGSQRRRKIYKDYKSKRRVRMRLNRVYDDATTPSMTDKGVLRQMQVIAQMIKSLPLTMMAIENIEADDTISFLATEMFNNDKTNSVTIMSADKDFYQLINDKVKVWSPTKKKMYGRKEIFDEYNITSRNFVFYRILDGDKSDNIDGVKGIGMKTAIKAFPILSEETQFSLEDLINESKDNSNGSLKAYKSISENEDIIRRNYSLMQLSKTDVSSFAKIKIQDIVARDVKPSNVFEFTKLLKKYNLFSVFKAHHIWLKETFEILDHFTKVK